MAIEKFDVESQDWTKVYQVLFTATTVNMQELKLYEIRMFTLYSFFGINFNF